MALNHRILYVGALDPARRTTAVQRMHALESLGHEVFPVQSQLPALGLPARTLRRLRRRFFRVVSHPTLDNEILDVAREKSPNLVWLDKADCIRPETLKELRQRDPGIRIVGFSRDDMMNPDNKLRFFVECLPSYDVFFTTKSFGVAELEALGCPRAIFVDNSFDPELHRPIELTPKERAHFGGPVGFIGTYEKERAESIATMGRAGIPVKVWGAGWDKKRGRLSADVEVAGAAQVGKAYSQVINSFDINLAFLRKRNRDRQTGRSVEIPACGKFMLAERSDEHMALYREGVEAEFFSDDQKLIEKTRYYLDHPEEREGIAAAGLQRCIDDRRSNRDRLRSMLEVIDGLD